MRITEIMYLILEKKYFRIGASRLANNLLNEIAGKETRYF
jgi:hypothetical protein